MMSAPAMQAAEGGAPDALTVEIAVEGGDWPDWAPALAEAAARWAYRDGADPEAEADGTVPATVSLLLADDATLHRLNREFRGKDKPTNVLSFENHDPAPPGEPPFLGDMALAWETLAREAEEQEKSVRDHFTHLVVHGMLHLMGMDHEEDDEAACMEGREVAILRDRFSIANPYREETA